MQRGVEEVKVKKRKTAEEEEKRREEKRREEKRRTERSGYKELNRHQARAQEPQSNNRKPQNEIKLQRK